MPTKRIAMEAKFPQAIANHWPVEKFATVAGVSPDTATRFLHSKAKEARERATKQLFALTADAGAIFHATAMRQLRRLQRLSELPDDEWTVADLKLEKHVMSIIRPLMEWARIPVAESIATATSPQLSDGL